MRPKKIVILSLVTTMCLFSGYVVAQCPYDAPPFTKQQQKQLCDQFKKQQDKIAELSAQLAKTKIEMITLKPNVSHPIGNIYAVLVGGLGGSSGGPNTGGVLVPLLPPPSPDQVVTFQLLGNSTCSVVLHFNSKQDFSLTNSCNQPLKAVVLSSANPVIPVD